MKVRPTLILFDFDGLSLSQRLALSWLVNHGGTATVRQTLDGANQHARHFGAVATLQTARALMRRDLVDVDRFGRVFGNWRVQVNEHAANCAGQLPANPPLMVVARTRAEVAAHLEHGTAPATWAEASATYCNHPYHDGDGPAPCPECGEGQLTDA